MDENLNALADKEFIETPVEEIVQTEPTIEDVDNDTEVDEIFEDIEVEDVETIEIEMGEGIGWSSGDGTNHHTLFGRDDPDQHPITAITGLKEKLDKIEKLKPLYANKVNIANYYEWKDVAYDEHGYFVSLVPGTSKIEICKGSEIFGVSVKEAGFVGGQDALIPRDNTYGLIATSGLVAVRCELDVDVGDYVTSNTFGYAEKTDTAYGYKVLAKSTLDGIEYAVISLDVQADVSDRLGAELQSLDSRMDAAETNIISAVNVANQAYQKSTEAATSSSVSEEAVREALKSILDAEQKIEDFEQVVGSTSVAAAQAKAIAESAVTSAEAMRNEAVAEANKALEEATELRKEFEQLSHGMSGDLSGVVSGLQDKQKELEQTASDMRDELDKAVEDFGELKKDLEPLATWPEGSENPTGIAGFVAQANENGVTLGNLVAWKDGDGDESLAGFVSKATEENAEIQALASYKYTDKEGKEHTSVAALDAYAKDNAASINLIAGVDGSIAGLQAQVDGNSASITTLASQTIGEYTIEENDWNIEGKNPQTIYYVTKTKEYYYYQDGQWKHTQDMTEAGLDGAIAGVKSIADANKAQFDAIAALDTENNSVLAGITAYVDANSAQISQLASYNKGGTHDTTQTSGVAGLIAQVAANKASIEALGTLEGDGFESLGGLVAQITQNASDVALVSRYIQGNYTVISELVDVSKREIGEFYYDSDNQKYWYYNSEATSDDKWVAVSSFIELPILQSVIYYVTGTELYWHWVKNADDDNGSWQSTTSAYAAGLPSSIGGIQIVTDKNSSSINSLTSWQGDTNTAMARIEQKADVNGAYIQSTVSNMDKYSVGPHSQAYGFTLEQAASVLEEGMIYVPTENTTETYNLAQEAILWVEEDKDINKVYYTSTTAEDGTVTKTYWHYDYDDGVFKWLESGEIPTITRSFTPTYLYKWGKLRGVGPYRWITVDKFYNDTDVTNTSAPAVHFQTVDAPTIGDNDKFGYWYTNGSTLTGTATGYESYTLYKWISGTNAAEDEPQWVAVATLAGNSSTRAVSQIRQDANSIEMRVTNTEGSYAGLRAELDETSAKVNSVAAWPSDTGDNKYNMAILKQHSDGDSSHLALAAIRSIDGSDEYKIDELGGAKIILADTEDGGSYIQLDASSISLKGKTIDLTTDEITIQSDYFSVDKDGSMTAKNGIIGNWNINQDMLYTGGVGLVGRGYSGDNYVKKSLITETNQAVRIYAGGTSNKPSESSFAVLDDGSVYASAVKLGNSTIGSDNSVFLSTSDMEGTTDFFPYWDNTLGETVAREDWRMTVGSRFGVTSKGTLYAKEAILSDITIGSTNNDCLTFDLGKLFVTSGSTTVENGRTAQVIGDTGCFAFTGVGGTVPYNMVFGWSPRGIQSGNTNWNAYGEHMSNEIRGLIVESNGTVGLCIPAGAKIGLMGDNGTLSGTWSSSSSNVVSSDKNLKHDIAILDDNYTHLFDSLQPVKFKYHNGTSDRYHTGFIAQDVCEATQNAGLTTNDFAAYVEFANQDDNSVECGLRYEEFIALCVSEIQKLKKRVSELENA